MRDLLTPNLLIPSPTLSSSLLLNNYYFLILKQCIDKMLLPEINISLAEMLKLTFQVVFN